VAAVLPFRALRPRPEAASRTACLPYDVMNTEEARAMARGNADSFLHVTRPEIDLPPGIDEHDDAVYAQAVTGLDDLRRRGVLVMDDEACLYLYRLVMGDHAQTGLVGAFSVDEYDRGAIVKHEHTRPDKEADRTRHILTLEAHAEPVFLVHRPSERLAALTRAAALAAPLYDVTASDGIRHTLWRLDAPAPFVDAFAAIDPVYIADGHHRAAAASNARRALRDEGRLGARPGANGLLAVAFPTDEAKILPYNRLVKDLHGRAPAAFLDALRGVAQVAAEPADATPSGPGDVRMFLDGRWWRLSVPPLNDDPVGRLDVQALQDRVLGPLLGIDDPRTSARISFVGGIRGTAPLEAAVRAGQAAVAFSLAPVTPEQLLSVADAGRTMPPKSTWFEPKLRSGLFVHTLQERA
jgi:uncharacterized protein (DUF1015 family)